MGVMEVFRLRFIRSRWKFRLMFMVFAVSLFSGCGQAQHEAGSEAGIKEASHFRENAGGTLDFDEVLHDNEIENDNYVTIMAEDEEIEEEESFSDDVMPHYFPANDSIKDSIYHYYGREEQEEVSEEEVEAVRGKLPAYFLTIHDGEEFALMREWYDWDGVHSVTVYFSEDLQEWQEEDLQALKILDDVVYVESDSGSFPVRALTYLTGAQEVYFSVGTDVSDVTGTLPEGTYFPKKIKSVTLYDYRERRYQVLLRVLKDSQVETITIRPDSEAEDFPGFWLDDVTEISSLKELVLENISIRVRQETALKDSALTRIEGCIDKDTNLSFVEELAQLEEFSGRIHTIRDLSPLLHRKGLSLYLDFYMPCPLFNQEVSWPKETGDEGFLGIYQRREDAGRVAECFTGRRISRETDEINMYSFDPWIRVTDGMTVYELRPGEENGGDFGFGDARSDRMRFADINFDGVNDIVLSAGLFGTQGLLYEFGYIWDQESGRYEFSPTYTMIGNPSIDSEHQLVRSSWRNWAASHSWAIYRYVNGEFVMQSMLTEEPLYEDEIPAQLEVPEGAEVWRWQEEIMKDGEVVEVRNSYSVSVEGEGTVYPEEYESYYEEDSYWGYGY